MSALSFTASGGVLRRLGLRPHHQNLVALLCLAPVAEAAGAAGDATAVALATGFSSVRVHAGTLTITTITMTVQRKTRMRPPRAKYAATITKFDAERIVANACQGVKVSTRGERRPRRDVTPATYRPSARWRATPSNASRLSLSSTSPWSTCRAALAELADDDASKPLCMRQSRQRWSWRDSNSPNRRRSRTRRTSGRTSRR